MEHKLKPFDKVLVRSCVDDVWCAEMFSHATKEMVWLTSHSCYSPSCVIPYEGNEHLLGTADDPTPEPEFKWGEHVEVLDNHNKWRKAIYLWQSICKEYVVLLNDKARVVPYIPRSFSICRHADW